MNVRAERFPLFDSLRAIAALMILVLHAGIVSGTAQQGGTLAPYVARLDVGVAVFFVISGFLLYRPFAAARMRGEEPPAVGAYAWRRFLRIAPAYWVALTVLALGLSLWGVYSGTHPLIYYGFLQMYDRNTAGGGIAQAWTLCVEVSFYVALPLIAAAVRAVGGRRRLAPELWVVGGLGALSVAYNVAASFGGLAGRITYAPIPLLSTLPASFFFFAIGMLMAVATLVLGESERRPWPVRIVERSPELCWALAAVAFVLAARVAARGVFSDVSAGQWMARQLLYAVTATALVAPAAFGGEGGLVRRLLSNRVLLYLGLISYGIYLWHLGLMLQLDLWGWGKHTIVHPYVFWTVSGLVASVAVASASYYLIERPALSLRRLVPPRPLPAEREALAEPAPVAPPAVER